MDEPRRTLPPITSSQTRVNEAAQSLCRVVKRDGPDRSAELPEDAPIVPDQEATQPRAKDVPAAEEMTLADLEQLVSADEVDESDTGWDAASFLRKAVPQVRRTGASLAGAAVRKMSK